MHQRLSQRLEPGWQGHERTVERLPLRRADHRILGVEIPFGIQRFEGLAQHLSCGLIDSRPLACLVDDHAFFSRTGVSVFSKVRVIVIFLFDVSVLREEQRTCQLRVGGARAQFQMGSGKRVEGACTS